MDSKPRAAILIVDDEPANLMAVEATLESVNQPIVKAASGVEALAQVLVQDFAVILLDVHMPGMTGIETATRIRERERSRQIPIIFLTGSVRAAEMMFQGYSAGAVDYILKPVEPDILRAKVEVFVELAIARLELKERVAERERTAAEIRQLNVALEQRNNDLTVANSDLEAFGHTVAHDLRAPLRHIAGYMSLLERTALRKLTPTEREQLATIRSSAERMNRLIGDLLTFSRLGRAEVRKGPVDVDGLLREVVSEHAAEAGNRNIVWSLQPMPEVPGDPGLLRQVLENLVANAVKYTGPRDPAEIEIGASRGNGEVIFHVRDNGVGFKSDHASRLYRVFSRLHPAEDFEGTGIGLATVRRIVEKHGGRVWANAKENEGATFCFALPAG
jgi:hypothetical protein